MPVHPFPPVRSRRVWPRQRRRGVRPSFARSLILVAAGGSAGTLAVLQMAGAPPARSEVHTSELQSLMRIAYAVLRLKTNMRWKQFYTPTSLRLSCVIIATQLRLAL